MSDASTATAQKPKSQPRSSGGWRLPVVLAIVAAAVVVAVVPALRNEAQTLVSTRAAKVASLAMEPTLHPGQTLLIQSYVGSDPQHGDIVTYHPPNAPNNLSTSRVIAVPGDTIAITSDGVILNGKQLDEPYAEGDNTFGSGPLATATIAPDHYFVLSDNRSDSTDSRIFGAVPRADIDGKVAWVVG